MYWDNQAGLSKNSVDPDQTPQNAASDQGPYCLSLIKKFLDSSAGSKLATLPAAFDHISSW